MSDIFDAFESNTTSNTNFFDSAADPAAEFLAREQEELAKIENDDFLTTNKTADEFSGMKISSDEFNNFGKHLFF